MRMYTKTAGLLFLAAAAVYTNQASTLTAGFAAAPAAPAAGEASAGTGVDTMLGLAAPAADAAGTDVKLLEGDAPIDVDAEGAESDPFAGPASQPTSQPVATEGQKLSESEVDVTDEGTVEIHVNDASLIEVLRMLSLQTQKNIMPSKDVRGTVTANLYDVTVREALDAILHSNGYAYREKGNFIYVYTAKELQEIEKSEVRVSTRVFRLNYTPASNATNLIKPVLSNQGQVALTTPAKSGIESGTGSVGGDDHASSDVLVITDFPENLDRVAQILAEIDTRPQQILLEAIILRATLNEDNALGVDFNVLSGVNFNALNIGETTGQITSGGVKTVPPPSGVGDDVYPTSGDRVSSVGTGQSFSNSIQGGLKVGFISNSISVFLSALEQTTDTTIMANPKILTLNKQKGEVFVGNEDGYYTTITTETTTSQTVETLKTGTRLIFRPYIAGDGYIRMEVHPEDSAGEVKANGLPSKSTTEVTSNIMVRDGHTVVIGGLFRESSQSTRSQIPLLGNLPLVGPLFRKQADRTIREEVIVLLTPHVVKDDAAYSALSQEQLRIGDQLRVGVRKGMMPWGRERLAQMWYNAALEELEKKNPDRKLAKWHLDSATNLNPKFAEAIQLKQQLTGREVTAADGSSVRSFVSRAILHDTAPAAPATQPAAEATTQPAGEMSVRAYTKDVPATQPATQPIAAAPATQPVAGEELPMDGEYADVAPATRPADETHAEVEFLGEESMEVTELPLEEIAPEFEGEDMHFNSK